MAIDNFEHVQDIATIFLERAIAGAGSIVFNETVKKARYARRRVTFLSAKPEFAKLPTSFGMSAWAAILSVDIRGSSDRAVEVGAKNTYISMHTFIPTMARLVEITKAALECKETDGVVGIRGDGLFAAFGLTTINRHDQAIPRSVKEHAVQSAVCCGGAMLETVNEIINPLFVENDIPAGLMAGVAIDVGEIVVTKIGLEDLTETTAYGPCVNNACKMRPDGFVMLSPEADASFPKTETGTIWCVRAPDQENIQLMFPDSMPLLSRW
jgi:class 3 adenylate cyclase